MNNQPTEPDMTGENITLAAAIFLASAKLIAFCIWGFGENSTNGDKL